MTDRDRMIVDLAQNATNKVIELLMREARGHTVIADGARRIEGLRPIDPDLHLKIAGVEDKLQELAG